MIEPDTLAALRLTIGTAAVVVPMNVAFGLAAGWAIGKFDFRGKTLLTALIEVPFAVSPVISGLVFVLAIGPRSAIGGWLRDHGVRVIFAWPGIALATAFVTFGYVAREVMTVMESTGRDKEEAAVVLGASGWQTFWHVTLPSIRWGLLYGVILCNARAMGEFGSVSVVSGHGQGRDQHAAPARRGPLRGLSILGGLRGLVSPRRSGGSHSRREGLARAEGQGAVMSFEVQRLEKRFGSYVALDGISLRVAKGELVALLGPSGCGKTTLLRVLAGLETADSGTVLFDGVDVTRTPPERERDFLTPAAAGWRRRRRPCPSFEWTFEGRVFSPNVQRNGTRIERDACLAVSPSTGTVTRRCGRECRSTRLASATCPVAHVAPHDRVGRHALSRMSLLSRVRSEMLELACRTAHVREATCSVGYVAPLGYPERHARPRMSDRMRA